MLDLKGAFSAVLIRVLPNCHLHFLQTVQIHCHLHFPVDHLHLPQTYPDLHQNHLPCLLVHLHHPLKLQLILIYHMHLSPRPLNPHLLLLLLQLPINHLNLHLQWSHIHPSDLLPLGHLCIPLRNHQFLS